MKTKINKYLTEKVFSKCWHEWNENRNGCTCGKSIAPCFNQDYFSNEDCMDLWLKIQEMDWFSDFWIIHGDFEYPDVIHPNVLASAVYEFLKDKDND